MNTSGLCFCGCGVPTPAAVKTVRRVGLVKGLPTHYLHGHAPRRSRPLVHPGYRHRVAPDGRAVDEHVLIAETALGKHLPFGAEVHHVDGNKKNNDPRNLVICQDHTFHALLHRRASVLAAGGNPNLDKLCCKCRRAKRPEAFGFGNGDRGRHNYCRDCRKSRAA